ncbi:superoxide dismutase family protein [Gordonia sp. DT30]|uniref:superoxide dismutase family protein n=1 Tax=unclassified Gordonia (in: high G+C Gram-positive bacteria) TaxID=2657482 RepID=UPI003CF45E10
MTVNSKSGSQTFRALAVLASAGAVGLALAACTPNEPTTTDKGTTPAVQTGNQAPQGGLVDADNIPASSSENGTATLIGTDGKQIGEAVFKPSGSALGVTVTVKAGSGIPAGFHAMHIHAGSACNTGDKFVSAGAHLQVDGHTGHPSSGDLISINILPDGSGTTTTSTAAVKLAQVSDKTIIIHENADNFANIPSRYSANGQPGPDEETMKTGDGGGRLACGVIKAGE